MGPGSRVNGPWSGVCSWDTLDRIWDIREKRAICLGETLAFLARGTVSPSSMASGFDPVGRRRAGAAFETDMASRVLSHGSDCLSDAGRKRNLKPVLFCRLLWSVALFGLGLFPSNAAVSPLLLTTGGSSSDSSVALGWDPSPSTNVTGYFLCWGLTSGQCTNQIDVGNITNSTVSGLTTNVWYYFTVVAYDGLGSQADPSNEIHYSVTNAPAPPAVTLNLGFDNPSQPTSLNLSFQGTAGSSYAILATEDFIRWDPVWTTNCMSDGPMVFSSFDATNYAKRFYNVVQQ